MAGGILQLVSNNNAVENRWLIENPDITLFKKVYRRYTPFSTEMVKIQFDHSIDFGQSGNVQINTNGDLIGKMFFVVDIPKLNAYFTKTKSDDISNLVSDKDINNLLFSSTNSSSILPTKKLTDFRNQAEISSLLDILNKTLISYGNEINYRDSILNDIESLINNGTIPVEIEPVYTQLQQTGLDYFDTTTQQLSQLDIDTDASYNFFNLKLNLMDIFTSHKTDYVMIYKFLKYIYQYRQDFTQKYAIVDSSFLTNILLYSSIFYETIPHREILLNFYLRNLNYVNIQNQSTNSLIETFDIQLQSEYTISIANLNSTFSLGQLYNASNIPTEITNTSFNVSPLSLDTHTLLKNVTFSFDNNYSRLSDVQNLFYDFGPGYLNMLNNYNLVNKIINNLTTTNPIVIVKAFLFNFNANNSNPNIYVDTAPTQLNFTYYPTIVDPNFKYSFINKINDLQDVYDATTIDDIYQNQYANEYLNLINIQLKVLFNNIKQNVDTVFEKYRNTLFISTNMLYLDGTVSNNSNNNSNNANIYYYTLPTSGFQDSQDLRISNVFNLNTWFFYFFTYLNRLDQNSFSSYMGFSNYSTYKFTTDGRNAIVVLMTIIKENITRYMNDISQRLNNMYSKAPSQNPNDTLKNYVPIAYNTIMNGVNINNLLALTIIYYRNHNPTILEMFEFIYYLCDNAQISSVTADELVVVRTTVKLLYYNIYSYFMNVYDNFIFEAPCNYTTSEYDTYYNINSLIKNYINYFFKGLYINGLVTTSQQSLVNENISTTAQMEFYFVTETIHVREMSKLYYNCLLNPSLILANVGQTTYEIIDNIIKTFIVINNDETNNTVNNLNISNYNGIDGSRVYYDMLYRQNIDRGLNDNLYYSTFSQQDISVSYGTNGYLPRDYEDGVTTNLKLINSSYYQNRQTLGDYTTQIPSSDKIVLKMHIPVYWITSTDNIVNTQAITSSYQLFDIDFFRIRHKIFFNTLYTNTNFSVDNFQLNLLKMYKLMERLQYIFPTYDYTLVYQLSITLKYVLLNLSNNLTFNPINTQNYYSVQTILNMFQTIINEQIKTSSYTNDLTISLITQVYTISINLFALYNGTAQIGGTITGNTVVKNGQTITVLQNNQTTNTIYTATTLIQFNNYIYSTVLNGSISPINNILNKINQVRDNFISQYFYYVKYENSIINIYNSGLINDDYTFANMSQIAYGILNVINYNNVDLTLLKNLSPLVLLYPDIYQDQLTQITNIQSMLDDFSRNISTLVSPYLTKNYIQRLTFKDVYDTINFTFYNLNQLCTLLKKYNLYTTFNEFIASYVPLFNAKSALFNATKTYLNSIINNVDKNGNIILLNLSNLKDLSNIAVVYGINYSEYYTYLQNTILDNFNKIYTSPNLIIGNRLLILNVIMFSSFDYFLIKYNFNDVVIQSTTFKIDIKNRLQTINLNGAQDEIKKCLNFINNDYYPFIPIFVSYIGHSNTSLDICNNPLLNYNKINFINDTAISNIQYNSYNYLSNVIEYFIDYITDWTLSIYNKSPLDTINDFDYTQRFSIVINNIHLKYLTKINADIVLFQNDLALIEAEQDATKQLEINNNNIITYFNNKKLAGIYPITSIVNNTQNERSFTIASRNTSNYEFSNYNYYILKLHEHNEVITLIKSLINKGIEITLVNRSNITTFQASLMNIFYRNKRAKSAWIKKLGHYLIDKVVFKIDDQVCDSHSSDWLEANHETSKTKGQQRGYAKMIGDLDSLTTFNDKIKNTHTLIIPLVFYFNNHYELSLPLSASLNTKYSLTISLKNIEQTTYSEQFSNFVDEYLNPTKIKLSNCHLMCEYIYLTQHERLHFATKYLEYLITDTQSYSSRLLSDSELVSVYKIGTVQKTTKTVVNRVKTQKIQYDYSQGIFMYENDIDNLPNGYHLLPRNDYVYRKIIDKTGISKLLTVYSPLPDTNPLVHKKNLQFRSNFNNPTKSLFLLIQPLKHTQIQKRNAYDNYFYGEHQWDNYTIYPRYDLSLINNAKIDYFNKLSSSIVSNTKFNFTDVVNNLINTYTTNLPSSDESDYIEQWINSNYSYFIQLLNSIINNYNQECIANLTNTVKLKENLSMLLIDYNLYNYIDLKGLIINITNSISVDITNNVDLSDTNIRTTLNYLLTTNLNQSINLSTTSLVPTNFSITKTLFRILVLELYYTQISVNATLISDLEAAINIYYDSYNESQIDLLITTLTKYINLEIFEYNIINIIYYFYSNYQLSNSNDTNILLNISTIYNRLQSISSTDIQLLNTTKINNIFYKNILYNLFNTKKSNTISLFVMTVLASKLNSSFNNMIDNETVDIIDYDSNLIFNDSINPLIDGTIELNSYSILPETANDIWWSYVQSYIYFNHSPSTGINLKSWSLKPLDLQPQGSINFSRVDSLNFNINLHPLIGNNNPVSVKTMVNSLNLVRYMSGMGAKSW